MRSHETPKVAPTSKGRRYDVGISRLLGNGAETGTVTRAVWFEAGPSEWQAIVDEESDSGIMMLPMK